MALYIQDIEWGKYCWALFDFGFMINEGVLVHASVCASE